MTRLKGDEGRVSSSPASSRSGPGAGCRQGLGPGQTNGGGGARPDGAHCESSRSIGLHPARAVPVENPSYDEAGCHKKPARMIPFAGDGWRRGAARERNSRAFAGPRSNRSTREKLCGRFLEVTARPCRRRRPPRGWSSSRLGSRECQGSAAGNERTIRRSARSSNGARSPWLGILLYRWARRVALGRTTIHKGC